MARTNPSYFASATSAIESQDSKMALLLNFDDIFSKERIHWMMFHKDGPHRVMFHKDVSHRVYQKYVVVIFEYHTKHKNISVWACQEIKVFSNWNDL